MNQRMANEENTTKWDKIFGTLSAVKDWASKEYQEGLPSLSEWKEQEKKASESLLTDIVKGGTQLTAETAGIVNRLMPRDDPS